MTSEGKIRIERLKLESLGKETSDSEPPTSGTARTDVSGLTPADLRSTDVRSLASVPAGLAAGDARTLSAWRQWLASMASDAESAMAAAIAYRDLDAEGREKWLESLEADAPNVDVPRIALYAPLIAVEHDPDRRKRLVEAIEDSEFAAEPSGRHRALGGRDARGARVVVVVLPLYLDFVQVLACAHDANGFAWVRHDPIVIVHRAPRAGDLLEGVRLEATPLRPTVDELAAAVLAHRRSKRPIPEALAVIADLLDPADHAIP